MSLTTTYLVAVGRVPDVFSTIRDAQAPKLFTQQLLKDWGFKSSNERAIIPLLKALGFLSPDGKPTSLYNNYRAHTNSKSVMAQGLRNAYEDLFLIKEYPTESDKGIIQGKFKSYHNVTDNVAKLMTRTFYALLKLSDLKTPAPIKMEKEKPPTKLKKEDKPTEPSTNIKAAGLHYNIQIHLPATKDIEVYNAIFKSLKEHLFDE